MQIEDKVFDFLTKKDNFQSAYEIHQKFPLIKDKLIVEFWMRVGEEVKSLIKNSKWEFEFDASNILHKYSGLYINITNTMGVGFGKLAGETDYGIWIDDNDETLNRERILEYVRTLKGLEQWEQSDIWPAYRILDHNFSEIRTLLEIIPENRDGENGTAKEFSNTLFDFAKHYEKEIKKMSKMTKVK